MPSREPIARARIERMRFAIIGAGGVGGYYGGVLARAGHEVDMLARGAHLEAIRARGLEIVTPDERFTARVNASDDVRAFDPPDVVIVSVKSYSIDEVAPGIAALASSDSATVVPLLNGVEAAVRLAELGVPQDRIVGGVTEISATRTAPGTIERKSPFQRVIIGELAGGRSERVERIVRAFADAGVTAEESEAIAVDLWRKLIFLASGAAACGLARSTMGAVREAPLGALLLERAVREAVMVGRARGVPLSDGDEARAIGFLMSMPPAMKPSLVLDIERGSRSELDILSGAISRYARELGVSTPVHDTATAALSAATSTPRG